jgi:hypothetical protein
LKSRGNVWRRSSLGVRAFSKPSLNAGCQVMGFSVNEFQGP